MRPLRVLGAALGLVLAGALPAGAAEYVHCSTVPLVLSAKMKESMFLECWRRPNSTGRVVHDIVQYAGPEGISMVVYSHAVDGAFIRSPNSIEETVGAVAPEVGRDATGWTPKQGLWTRFGTAEYSRFKAYNGLCFAAIQVLRRREAGIAQMLTLVRCVYDGLAPDETEIRAFIDSQQTR